MSTECLFVLSDDQIKLEVHRDKERFNATLTVLSTGRAWGPVPLVTMEVHDRTVRREDHADRFELLAVRVQTETEVRVVLGRDDLGLEFELWLRVIDGELVTSFNPLEMYETRDQHFRVFDVDLLPGLAAVGSDGKMLLPCATGMITSPHGKPKISDKFLIYMEQARWELTPLLPVVAASDPEGGLILIATEGDCDAQVKVQTDGQGSGSVSMGAMLRQGFFDPMDHLPRRVLISPIAPGDDLLHTTAKRLRRHVTETLGRPTLSQRAEESPEIDYALNAFTMKAFYGMQNIGLERAAHLGEKPTYNHWMTFNECGQWTKRLKELGVENIYFQHTAWQVGGHDAYWPTRFPIDERLGGEAGFRELIQLGKDLGYQVSVHDNFMCNVGVSPDWDDEYIVQDEAGRPLLHGWWGGGLEYTCWPLAFGRERLDGHFEKIKELGVQGPYYCDYMFQPLEINHHPKHRGPRSGFNKGMQHILHHATKNFGASATELGTLPAVLACDYIATCTSGYHLSNWRDDWPVTALRDEVAPLWQLTLQGLVLCEAQGGDFWSRTLEALTWGRTLRDEWQAHPGKHPLITEQRAQELAAVYPICQERFGYLKTQELMTYEQLGEHQHRSHFADGSVVETDFDDRTLRVNGEFIECPEILKNQKK